MASIRWPSSPKPKGLPSKSLSPPYDVTYTWKGEVRGEDESPSGGCFIEEEAPSRRNLLGGDGDGRTPLQLLEMDRMEHGIGDVE